MSQHESDSKILLLTAALLFILFGGFAGGAKLYAQTSPTSPDRGAKLGNSFSAGEFETVNTTNGNLMLNFPLGSLAPGRGGISSGISLVYNSKLYSMRSVKMPDYRHFDGYFYKTIIDQDYKGGWSLVGGVRLEFENRMDTFGEYVPQCSVENNELNDQIIYNNKLRIVLPDGSTHEMIPYGHYDKLNDRYFNIDMAGRVQSCYGPPTYTTPPTYYSVDGSYLRLKPNSYGDWTLYMPDGGRVVQSPNQASQKIYDRNGNYVNVSPTQVSDEFGRSVTVTVDTNGDNLVTSKGFDGADLVWRIKWKFISVSKTYTSCPDTHSCPPEDQTSLLQSSFRVVDKIIQPSQLGSGEYVFTYNVPNSGTSTQPSYGWGEVSGIQMPTGAQISYQYLMDGQDNLPFFDNSLVLKNYPGAKTLTYQAEYDGGSTLVTETTGYSITSTESSVTAPDGSVTYTEFDSTEPISPGEWKSGLTLKTIQPDGTKKENLWARNLPVKCTQAAPEYCGGSNNADNPYVKTEFTSIKNADGTYVYTAVKDYEYDKNGNVIQTKEYDFIPYDSIPREYGRPIGLPSNADNLYLKRITKSDFYNPTPNASSTNYGDSDSYHLPSSLRLLRLTKSTEVQNAANAPQMRSEITYDHTNYSASNTKGGNPTETKVWDSNKGGIGSGLVVGTNAISTQAQYDDTYGNVIKTIDANLVETTITYGCIDGSTSCSDSLKNLYPTKTEVASNHSAVKRTTTVKYDFYSGLTTSTTDVDNNLTAEMTYDGLGRPTKTAAAVGTALEVWTQTVYDDANRKVIVKSDLETKGDAKNVATQFYDQLGRVRLSKTLENSATQSATNETDGIKVQTRYSSNNTCTYDNTKTCSFRLISNPYRANYSYNAVSEPTMGWTRSQTVNTSNHSEVETFNGAVLPYPWASNLSSTGKVKSDFDAERTLVTDQAGKQRISKTNALGQLTDVWEVKDSDSDTEAISFSISTGTLSLNGLKTSYQYDTLNNLTTINQGTQTPRSFSYSSLSRLLSAANPESGMISYVYYDNGNLKKKTDARSIDTEYFYDALNRVTARNYSDSTPDVTYTYGTVAPAIGKLTKVENGFSKTEYTQFDLLGRVTRSKQTTDGVSYGSEMEYVYNLSGSLIEETYPSTRKVRNVLDNNGDLSMVQSKKSANYGFWNYAQNFTYNSVGAVSSMQLGNFKWESSEFNSRLQPTQIALGTVQNGTDKLKLNFTYNTTNNNTANPDNNGNVLSQTITVPTETKGINTFNGFTATQTYTYDALNRLHDAKEVINNSSTPEWKQTFIYDRYGNRTFDESNTTTLPRNCGVTPNLTVCAKDNPIANTSDNRLSGINFDAVGNTRIDANNRRFTYDAENKQIKVEVVNSGGTPIGIIGEYFYDSDAKRVKKIAYDENYQIKETTIFIYDAFGKMVAEYSTQVAAQQDARVSYLTTDHLDSPRINTDQTGQIIARHDYQPFGEEITRTSYEVDTVRQQFTLYERDRETNLDFAQARMYANRFGRFTTTDPIMMQANRLIDPQAINLYVYVRNNPLKYTDPGGNYYVGTDGKKVKVKWSRDSDGNIIGIKKLGKNATPELQRIANLINKTKSENALSIFVEGNYSLTKVNLEIGDGGGSFMLYHDKAGSFSTAGERVPDFIWDKKRKSWVFREITIHLGYVDSDKDPELFQFLKNAYEFEGTSDEYLVGDFGHELRHGLSQYQIGLLRNFLANYNKATSNATSVVAAKENDSHEFQRVILQQIMENRSDYIDPKEELIQKYKKDHCDEINCKGVYKEK